MELLFEELAKKNGSRLFNIEKRKVIDSIPNMQFELTQIFKQLAEDPSWVFEDLTQKDTSYITHGFHKYPAKFIPQLAKRCIEENTKIPRRWCVIGIEAWLDDFAERISQTDENKRELLKIDLQYEKQRLQLTNQMITKCNQVIQK